MNDPVTTVNIEDPQAPEAQAPEAQRERTAFTLFPADLRWPGPGEARFYVDVPQPAIFQRAYRTEVRNRQRNKLEPVMRLVWLAAPAGEVKRVELVLQRIDDAMLLADDDLDPKMLGLVVGAHGEPIAVWQLAIRDVPKPCPSRKSRARPRERRFVERPPPVCRVRCLHETVQDRRVDKRRRPVREAADQQRWP